MSSTQAAFEEDLYSRPVRQGKLAIGDLHPVAVVLLLVAVIGLVNYQFLGYGPEWAHKATVVPAGSSWRGFHGEGWSASLPPDLGSDSVAGPTGAMHRTWAGIDSHWDTVAGGGTLPPAAARRASTDLVAEVVVAVGSAPPDATAAAAQLVTAALPGSTISDVKATIAPKDAHDQTINVTASFDGGISVSSHGGVLARIYVDDNTYYLVSTFTKDGNASDIHDKLVTGFAVASAR